MRFEINWNQPLNSKQRKHAIAYAERDARHALERGEAFLAVRIARQLMMAQPKIARHKALLDEAQSVLKKAEAMVGGAAIHASSEQLYALALMRVNQGDYTTASSLFLDVAKANPSFMPAFIDFAWCMMRIGNFGQAMQIISSIPREACDAKVESIRMRNAIYCGNGDEAFSLANKALVEFPDACTWLAYGAALQPGREATREEYMLAELTEVFANLIHLEDCMRKLSANDNVGALRIAQEVLDEIPTDIYATNFKTITLFHLNQDAAAIHTMLSPGLGAGNSLKGVQDVVPLLWKFGLFRQSYELGKPLLDTFADDLGLRIIVTHAASYIGEFDIVRQHLPLLKQQLTERSNFANMLIFPLLALLDAPDLHLKVARFFFQGRVSAHKGSTRFADMKPFKGERIKIAYMSSDYHNHATLRLLTEVIEMTDRSKFEIFAYSYDRDAEDFARKRLKAAVDHFVDVSEMTDVEIAERGRRDGIHIAVDLKGHTQDTRLVPFIHQIGAVQAAWLGYPGSCGIDQIDYILGDYTVTPEGAGAYYSEKIVRLPNSYQPNDRKRTIDPKPTRAEEGLPEKGLVFASFNQIYKILPDVFDAWLDIMKGVPGSVLWLHLKDPATAETLRAYARSKGVDGDRIIGCGDAQNARHLARYLNVDLALDTFPYGSHTTGSDALWAGCPVLTLTGQSFASRASASLVSAVGLPELICNSIDEFREKAISLGKNPQKLKEYRDYLEKGRDSFALFDASRFARNLGRAYEMMYEKWARGEAPGEINVTEDR